MEQFYKNTEAEISTKLKTSQELAEAGQWLPSSILFEVL